MCLVYKIMQDSDALSISCTVTNTGTCAGSEIVQLYVACKNSAIIRPEQGLKGFEKVFLAPGEIRQVSFTLSGRDFAYYNAALAGWHVERADYEVRISASSQDVRLSDFVHVDSTVRATLPDLRKTGASYYDLAGGIKVSDAEFTSLLGRPIPPRERQKGAPHTLNSTMADIQDKLLGRMLSGFMTRQTHKMFKDDPDFLTLVDEGLRDLPVRFLVLMSGGAVSIARVEGLVEMLNGRYPRGLRMMLKKQTTT